MKSIRAAPCLLRSLLSIGVACGAAWFAPAALADSATLAAINAMRLSASCTPGADAKSAADAPPLAAHARLDAAAAELADNSGGVGRPLNEVLRGAGYRATRSMFLQIGGVAQGAALARFLGQRYCQQITSREWLEIGLHQRFSASGQTQQAWVVLARPFAPPPPERADELGARVLELINLARGAARDCGGRAFAAAAPVKWNAVLARASQLHADDMAAHSYFSHDGRDGSKPAARATRAGYVWRAVGENIAAGQTSAEEAVQGWIDSPPHCANLMGAQFTEMGVAYAVNLQSVMGIYWTQVFGTPR